MYDIHINMTFSNGLCLVQQQLEWANGHRNRLVGVYTHSRQTQYEQNDHDIGQTVVVFEDIALRTNDGKAPLRIGNGHVAHQRALIVDVDRHVTLFALRHFVAQRYHVRILLRISDVKDGLLEQSCCVRMSHVATFLVKNDIIGMRVWQRLFQ